MLRKISSELLLHKLLVLAIIFLPFSGSGSAISPVFYFLVLCLATISIALLYYGAIQGKFSCCALLTCMAVISTLLVIGSIQNNLVGFVEIIPIIVSIPIVYGISQSYRYEQHRIFLSKTMLLLGLVHSFFGLWQLWYGFDPLWGNPPPGGRPSGIFSWHAPVVGSFVGVALVFFYALPVGLRRSWSWRLVFSILFITLVLSGNRSVLLIHIAILVYIFLSANWYKSLAFLSIVVLAVINVEYIVDFVLAIIGDFISPNQAYRISSLAGAIWEEQQGKRVATWVQTVCAINERPFFGYSIGVYPAVLEDYLYCAKDSEGVMPHPHNFYLEIAFYFGYVGGFFVIVSILVALLVGNMSRADRVPQFIALGFISPLNVTHGIVSFWWLFLLAVLVGFGSARRE